MKLSMRRFVPWGLGFLLAGLVAHGGCASTEVSTPFPDSGNPGLPDGGDPGRLDGGDPRQKLTVQIDPAKATIARKGTLQVKVTILIGGKSAAVTLVAPAGSGLTAARQVANADGQAVLEIKASDTAETKASQKVTVVAEGFDGTTRGEATLDLEVRGAPGELDTSWGTGGFLEFGNTQELVDAVMLPSGELLVGFGASRLIAPHLRRVDTNGKVDIAFGSGGECALAGVGASVYTMGYVNGAVYAALESAGTPVIVKKVATPCAVSTPFVFPQGRMTGIGRFQSVAGRLAILGASETSWVAASFTEATATTLELATSWGNQGYVEGTPRQSPRAWVEGVSADTLYLAEGFGSFGTVPLSKQPAPLGAGQAFPGELMGVVNIGTASVPVSMERADDDVIIRTFIASGTKSARLTIPQSLIPMAVDAGDGRSGYVVAVGVGVANAPPVSGVVLVRMKADGDVDRSFGEQGMAKIRVTNRGIGVGDLHRLLVRDGKAYVVGEVSFGNPVTYEAFIARVWL